jgi:hypothetical protein
MGLEKYKSGGPVMKNVLFSLLTGLTLLCCSTAFAAEQDKAAAGRDEQTETNAETKRRTPADINDLVRQAELRRLRYQDRSRERLERRKQEMVRAREEALKLKEEGGGSKPPRAIPAMGKDKPKQLDALKQQISSEEQKHLKRLAQLNRIRELAVQEDSTETFTRADTLLNKEKRRHANKLRRLQARLRRLLRPNEVRFGPEGRRPTRPRPPRVRTRLRGEPNRKPAGEKTQP